MIQADLVHYADALGVAGSSSKSVRAILDRNVRALVASGAILRHEGRLWLADGPVVTTLEDSSVA